MASLWNINNKLLTNSSSTLLRYDDICCCVGKRCEECADIITGVSITVLGVVPWPSDPPEVDCYCGQLNGQFFADADPADPCRGHSIYPYVPPDEDYCPPPTVWSKFAYYVINCLYNPLGDGKNYIQLYGRVEIINNFQSTVADISGQCITGFECGGTCSGAVCIATDDDFDPHNDVSSNSNTCDISGATMILTAI